MLRSVSQRWRHCERIVAHRLDKSLAFRFVRFVDAVVLPVAPLFCFVFLGFFQINIFTYFSFFPVAPARHWDTVAIVAGELLLVAAGELEHPGVGGGGGAGLGVVVDRPLLLADQQRVLLCIRGREKIFLLPIDGFPQGEVGVKPETVSHIRNNELVERHINPNNYKKGHLINQPGTQAKTVNHGRISHRMSVSKLPLNLK